MNIKQAYLSLILLFTCACGFSQSGCTDNLANNYQAGAITNNGSCTYDSTFLNTQFVGDIKSFATESSGLVFTDGKMWTHNDSGNPADIYQLDTATGQLIQTVHISNYANNDWEDIAADSDYIYVGDFGNNNGDRTNLRILKITKSQIGTGSTVSVNAQAINFSYADQTDFSSNSYTNYNCEALIAIDNTLYIFTKRGDLTTTCYKLSKTPGNYVILPYAAYNSRGKVTGATYNPSTRMVALIGYEPSSYNSFMYLLYDFAADSFFTGNKRRLQLGDSVNRWQTEGVAFVSDNEVFISCETSNDIDAGLYKAFLPLASTTTGNIQGPVTTNSVQVYPNPSKGMFTIQTGSVCREIEVFDADGREIEDIKCPPNQNRVLLNSSQVSSKAGVYLLKIVTADATEYRKVVLY